MKELDADELRAFLAGDDTHLATSKVEHGWFGGSRLGDPMWPNRYSEIRDGELVVRSRFRGEIAQFPLKDLSCAVHVSVRRRLQEGWAAYFWIVDQSGHPVAEVPWGSSIQQHADEVALRVRRSQPPVDKEAFETLRPQARLVR